ncbi:MAG: PaaI family thioesterase [Phycisphaerae bacterium]
MKSQFASPDPGFRQRIRSSFSRQGFLRHLGVEMIELQPGYCEMEVAFGEQLSQQHGYFHGGLVATVADVAAGYAAFSLTEWDGSMVTAEFKINFIAPAKGERLIARGSVIKPGRTLTVCQCDVVCINDGTETMCAVALATFIALPGKPEKTT